jgi:hypothetical protein
VILWVDRVLNAQTQTSVEALGQAVAEAIEQQGLGGDGTGEQANEVG